MIGKILEEEMFIRLLTTTVFQIFCKINHNFHVIVKSIIDPDNHFKRNTTASTGERIFRVAAIGFLLCSCRCFTNNFLYFKK